VTLEQIKKTRVSNVVLQTGHNFMEQLAAWGFRIDERDVKKDSPIGSSNHRQSSESQI
jgi:hypothetical protein